MISNLIRTLKRMYDDADYKAVNQSKIQSYLDKGMITQEEYSYIIGEQHE